MLWRTAASAIESRLRMPTLGSILPDAGDISKRVVPESWLVRMTWEALGSVKINAS